MIGLKSVIASLNRYKRCGSEYYKIVDFEQRLNSISSLDTVEDIVLTPFYLTSNSTYEIYDFELNIRNVKQSNRKNYFLLKTGKLSLQEIDKEILEKLDMCYIEVVEGHNMEAIEQLKKYLGILLEDIRVKERVPVELGQFHNTNLYCEVYF